ncbi:hypothetical protein BASA50_003477 [Batrachochytrium salamandrivorans]|uniref:Cystatin domain-containing protein n=1 Tax=Batrachochytrium salamandrivorans TaxID=1357716 RepID=A0ABQ8FKF9_9FUNG|nr:hypothetical protein BASA62_003873 [Batrachochytrium salamandrivorans]KAH6575315.1 hypothetical protein BASA60_005120 [Batrachochytrium salamandrivorans]KAH6598437.1 hypothetical protein BASA50_003477 [Batrachochytrium salamandrivorans]KAH6599159.1 hypothetical protein BASA61_002691 [Batrachochytrium salamandrivorans]KAH9266872.1 hypothetical protein BASA84_000935 [Batrachochytrium salamandrivorans]
MKFNAIVVAAMVITSVNAGGKKGLRGRLGKNGRMTESESKERPNQFQFPQPTIEAETNGWGNGEGEIDCSSMFSKLEELQSKIPGPAQNFDNQLPSLHAITKKMVHWTTTQNGDTSKEHGEDGAKVQNTKKLKDPSGKYFEARSNLKETRHDLSVLNGDYYRFWLIFTTQCDPTKYPNLMNPDELKKKEGSFFIKDVELPEDMRGTSSAWAF